MTKSKYFNADISPKIIDTVRHDSIIPVNSFCVLCKMILFPYHKLYFTHKHTFYILLAYYVVKLPPHTVNLLCVHKKV